MKLLLANNLPPDPISFLAQRIVLLMEENFQPRVWLWAETRESGHKLLLELRDTLGERAGRLVRSCHTLYLRGSEPSPLCGEGRIEAMIPRIRPDGERFIAAWMATSKMPEEHARRLLCLGQCQEFWVLAGSVPDLPSGDWRHGPEPK